MHYEINVSRMGMHFFATTERSITSESSFKTALKIFNEKFPRSEGYVISASLVHTTGHCIDINKILEEIACQMKRAPQTSTQI